MIVSCRDKRTAAVFRGKLPKGFPSGLGSVCRRKLAALDATAIREDLRKPPGNPLEALKGDRSGEHSVRVIDQWRLCFVWRDGHAHHVEIAGSTRRLCKMIRRGELDSVDFSDVSSGETIPPVIPGDVLRLDFMEPLKLSARALARDMGVPPDRVTEIINGRRSITAETAILLGWRFGTTPRFWMNLQVAFDLEKAERTLTPA